GRAETATAVQHDLVVVPRDLRLDVPLEDASPDMHRAGQATGGELALLAHIDQVEPVAAIQTLLHGRHVGLLDPRTCLVHDRLETRIVLCHCNLPRCFAV